MMSECQGSQRLLHLDNFFDDFDLRSRRTTRPEAAQPLSCGFFLDYVL